MPDILRTNTFVNVQPGAIGAYNTNQDSVTAVELGDRARWNDDSKPALMARLRVANPNDRIRIVGREAAEIVRRVNRDPHYKWWTEVQGMRECKHGCKLYARRRGCVTQFMLFHSTAYGCALGSDAKTKQVPVSVLPKAKA